MNKLVILFAFSILVFFTCQNASAFTMSAVPQKQEFEANDWIKVNLSIHGYDGGHIKWIAHRPDSSTISGTIYNLAGEETVHQIIRDAFDSEFGQWSINYIYRGVNQTVNFQVKSLNLAVSIDKATYYEPDTMKINITTSYYIPQAKFAKSFYLNFFDEDGNRVTSENEIEIKATKSNIVYYFPVIELVDHNPPGLYNLKIRYFNSTVNIPFALEEIRKLMEITVQPKAPTYHTDDNVVLDLIVTRVKESTGVIIVTDPQGNKTMIQFPVNSVHSELSLEHVTKQVGTYKFDIQYAGAKKSGTFKVVANNKELPNIDLDIYLNKINYRKGEIVEARVNTSDIIADSINSWVTDPQGQSHRVISIPVSSNDVMIPYKIMKNDQVGKWQFFVNYGGVVRSSVFYVGGEILNDSELLNSGQFFISKYPSYIGSGINSPTAVAIDSEDNIYVSEYKSSQIKKFDLKGNLLFTIGNLGVAEGQFIHPMGVFVNEKYVYVLDTGNSRIQMFDKSGKFVYSWGKYGDEHGMFHLPVSMSSDKFGNLFVADSESNVIQIFDPLGNYKDEIVLTTLEGEESNFGVKSITFDSENNFYAVSTNNKILKYSSIGEFINFYGSPGTEKGRFNQPTSIATDSDNYLYVTDLGNQRIDKFDSNGNFILSFATKINESDYSPTGIAIDSSNNIYVVDKNQDAIQRFENYHISGEVVLPDWIKKNAVWWSEGALDKPDFALGIKYLVNQGIIQVSNTPGHGPTSNFTSNEEQLKKLMKSWTSGEIDKIPTVQESFSGKIPDWLKKNVQLWSLDEIDDQAFFTSIKYLISVGIIEI